ncbi:MAG: Rpn family recombination-promoting nuclease/putative transposase [Rhodoferax sp.]|nr:Rpn family recombination-promoting nuclease/putative transposase [Rhodoferax sp.]MCF8208815.1 Rpn family recombination-promoting nuclease/putative transposase [Rhodoferax sp.]
MKFLDVKTDYAFKKVFGSEGSKAILLSFLNAFDFFGGEQTITDLTIVDPYQIPLIKGMKDTYVDVKARLSNGASVIIEMQVLNVPGLEQRILYNAAKAYSTQLLQGERYHLLNPVIALTITDFVMFDDSTDYKSCFKLIEKDRLIDYQGDIELVFIELPKFQKTATELSNIVEQWIYFIQNAGKLDYIPDTMAHPAELAQAFSIANEAGLSPEELETQWRRRDFIILQRSSIEKAWEDGEQSGISKGFEKGIEQGIEQGIERGIEQGREDQRNAVIAQAHRNGLSPALIASLVGLDEAAVREQIKVLGITQGNSKIAR